MTIFPALIIEFLGSCVFFQARRTGPFSWCLCGHGTIQAGKLVRRKKRFDERLDLAGCIRGSSCGPHHFGSCFPMSVKTKSLNPTTSSLLNRFEQESEHYWFFGRDHFPIWRSFGDHLRIRSQICPRIFNHQWIHSSGSATSGCAAGRLWRAPTSSLEEVLRYLRS